MKHYFSPSAELIHMQVEDVIATSPITYGADCNMDDENAVFGGSITWLGNN